MAHLKETPKPFGTTGSNTRIPDAIITEINEAKASSTERTFALYDIEVIVHHDSDPKAIYLAFLRAFNNAASRQIGPHPPLMESVSPDALRRHIEAQSLAASAGEINLKDPLRWSIFRDTSVDACGFGQMVFAYTERWALIMQARMLRGESLSDIVLPASYDADLDGIRRLALPTAIAELYPTWYLGDELFALTFRFAN